MMIMAFLSGPFDWFPQVAFQWRMTSLAVAPGSDRSDVTGVCIMDAAQLINIIWSSTAFFILAKQ